MRFKWHRPNEKMISDNTYIKLRHRYKKNSENMEYPNNGGKLAFSGDIFGRRVDVRTGYKVE